MADHGMWLAMNERIEKKVKPETLALKNSIQRRNNEALKQDIINRVGEEGLKPCKSKWPSPSGKHNKASHKISSRGIDLSNYRQVEIIDDEIYQADVYTGELIKCPISNEQYPKVGLAPHGYFKFKKRIPCHRLVAAYYSEDGVLPNDVIVDHKNGDTKDYRAVNLRIVNVYQNNRNRPEDRELIRYSNSIEGNVLL